MKTAQNTRRKIRVRNDLGLQNSPLVWGLVNLVILGIVIFGGMTFVWQQLSVNPVKVLGMETSRGIDVKQRVKSMVTLSEQIDSKGLRLEIQRITQLGAW